MAIIRFKSIRSNARVATGAKVETTAEGIKFRVPEEGLQFSPATLHIGGKDVKVGLLVLDDSNAGDKVKLEKLRGILASNPAMSRHIKELSEGEFLDYTLAPDDRAEIMEEAAKIVRARNAAKKIADGKKGKGKGASDPDEETN